MYHPGLPPHDGRQADIDCELGQLVFLHNILRQTGIEFVNVGEGRVLEGHAAKLVPFGRFLRRGRCDHDASCRLKGHNQASWTRFFISTEHKLKDGGANAPK